MKKFDKRSKNEPACYEYEFRLEDHHFTYKIETNYDEKKVALIAVQQFIVDAVKANRLDVLVRKLPLTVDA